MNADICPKCDKPVFPHASAAMKGQICTCVGLHRPSPAYPAPIVSKETSTLKTPTQNKYRAQKTEVDGILFDSKRESKRYSELRLMENAGEITNLLVGAMKTKATFYRIVVNGVRITHYHADFVYTRDSKTVVEDAKGYHARDWPMRKKLMLAVHGITIVEV